VNSLFERWGGGFTSPVLVVTPLPNPPRANFARLGPQRGREQKGASSGFEFQAAELPDNTVIASAAKQSTLAILLPHGLLRCARNDGKTYVSAISPRDAPELCLKIPPSEIRGRSATPRGEQGKPGARCTRSRAWCVESTRVSHHRFTGTPGLPCAMVLTAYFALSPVTGLCCHRHRRDAKHHRQLDASVGASGPHDFAVRAQCHSSFDMPRPPHPAPNVRDDRETPLCTGRDGERYAGDLGQKGMKIFCKGDSTGKSLFGRHWSTLPDREAM